MKKYIQLSLILLLQTYTINAFPSRSKAQSQNTSFTQITATPTEEIRTKTRFKPPKVGAPTNRTSGATRGNNCSRSQKSIKALLPESNIGLTLEEHPTFFVYVPQTSTQLAEFELREANNNQLVYKSRLMVPTTSGIISIKSLQSLKVGTNYRWVFSIICNPEERSEDLFVGGWVQRIKPSPTLAWQLEKATLRSLPTLYAEAGIWHETLTKLVDLRYNNPNDLTLIAEWTELLESVGLSQYAKEALVYCDNYNQKLTKDCQSQ